MENLKTMALRDNELMKILKVGEIRHPICGTDKGQFNFVLSKDGKAKDYRFVLDSVPVDAPTNKLLLAHFDGILFKL